MTWYYKEKKTGTVALSYADPIPGIVTSQIPGSAKKGDQVTLNIVVRNDGGDGYLGATFFVFNDAAKTSTYVWSEPYSFVYSQDQDGYWLNFTMPDHTVYVEISTYWWRDGTPVAGPVSEKPPGGQARVPAAVGAVGIPQLPALATYALAFAPLIAVGALVGYDALKRT